MKKNISVINLDHALLNWMVERLKTAPPEAESARDLADALADLANGNSSSLMMELEDEGSVMSMPPSDERIVSGDLVISVRSRRVTRAGMDISLTPKEFDILYFLARNRGEVFTKEQIYKAVWDDNYLLDDSNIMAFIRKLRKKIEPQPDAPQYILTIWGIGYKFTDSI